MEETGINIAESNLSENKWYHNLSLEDVDAFILANMKSAVRSVIAIGYYLKCIRDGELYREAGYDSIWEYASEKYGFSKSTAVRYMKRNDKFSVDGNSPILAEEYRGFGKSQLQEMLSLDEEQLEQVTPDMTVRQIRELRKPVQKEIPYYEIPGQLSITDFPGITDEEVHQVGKIEERSELIPERASFTMSTADFFAEPVPTAELEPGVVVATSQQGVSEEPELLSAYGTLERVYPPDSLIATSGCEGGHDCFSCAMECSIRQKDRYCRQAPMGNPFPCTTMNVLELLREEMGDKCQFVNHDLAFHRQGDGEPDPCCEVCEELCGFRCGKAKNVEVQSEPEVADAEFEEVIHENLYTPQYFLNKEQEKLNEMLEAFKDTPPDQIPQKLFAHQKIIVAALASMVCDLEEEELRKQLEEEKPQQPEFPQLKNNDQRAAFIDAYATWPIWIETRETGERYYRYELPDAAMVVKVYFHKCFDYNAPAGKWEDRHHDAWGNPEYYLVQDKKHFKDCQTNRSSLIDYLKNIQKERVRL